MQKIDWSQLTYALKRADFLYITIGMIFGFGFNMAKFMKWHVLIKAGSNTHSYWDAARSYMIGNALGMVTPMRAGDLGRSLYFVPQDRPRIIGLTIVDRTMDLVSVLLLSIAGSFVVISKSFGIIITLLSVFGLFSLYSIDHFGKLVKNIFPDGYLKRKFSSVIDILHILDTKTVILSLSFSIVAFILTILEFYYVVSAFEATTLWSMCLTTPLITLSALIPITFMGLGVREGLAILLFSTFGISAPAALSAAFLCFVINNVTISFVGLLYFFRVELATGKVDSYASSPYPENVVPDTTD
jgi:uncharacterized protein (TIRG00374 family)